MSTLLAISPNDHLAGVIAGVQLARRAPKENRDNDDGRFLATLAEETSA